MTEPTFSVIMANYNGATYLPQALASIRDQTLGDWELIAVDDASTDGSQAILKTAAEQDPRVRVFLQPENRGPGAARNRGLGESRGRWVAIFDADDVMKPERLARLLARAEQDDALIVADNQIICDADLTPREVYLRSKILEAPRWVDLADFVASSELHSKIPDLGFLKPIISKSAIRTVGARYDEALRIGEDFHFVVQLLAAGLRIRLEPEPLYAYRKHGSSTSHRLSAATLNAILAADDAFLARSRPLEERVTHAFRRRREGLSSWLAHDRTIQALKARRPVEAILSLLRRPQAWPLLAGPLQARRRRLAKRLMAPLRRSPC